MVMIVAMFMRVRVIVSMPVPLFVRVTFSGVLLVKTSWTGKVRLGGENVTAGCTPVPESDAVCGLPLALSETVSVPV